MSSWVVENYAWPTIWDFFDRSLYSLQQRQQVLKFNMSFHDSVKIFFSKHQNKYFKSSQIIDFKNLDDSVVIFQTLKTSAASLTSVASAASLASTASTALFPQKTSWSWWFDHPWYQNYQYWSFFVEWIIKNPFFY